MSMSCPVTKQVLTEPGSACSTAERLIDGIKVRDFLDKEVLSISPS